VFAEHPLIDGITMRVLQPEDAAALAAAYVRNREHLAPWEPLRSETFFTEQWQADDIAARLAASATGDGFPLVLLDGATVVGRFTLAGIVRGPFQSARLSYWVDHGRTGRGLVTAAVRDILRVSRDDLGLHRVEASTLRHNIGSRSVLLGSGFQQIGMAPQYLCIAGVWQDHDLYQAILHD
jgi:ribosomal-protein-alanine N-acetyltransferase